MDRPNRLSKRYVTRLSKTGRYFDGRGAFGLTLLVRESARGVSKNWVQRVTVGGKRRDLGLGTFPAVSLDDARALAAENMMAIRAAIPRRSPVERLIAGLGAPAAFMPAPLTVAPSPTFADTADEALALKDLSERTLRQTRRYLAQDINPVIGEIPVGLVTAAQVLDILKRYTAKPETLQKLSVILSATFKYSIGAGHRTDDPVQVAKAALPKNRHTAQHRRAAPIEKVGEIMRFVRESKYEARAAALEFMVLTAVRPGEVLGARWTEIDWKTRTWTIPAERMKSRRDHRVPLSQSAEALLCHVGLGNDSEFVFAENDKMLPDGGLRRLLKARYPDIDPHGFRSTFTDWAATKTDFPKELIEHALAHLEGTRTEQAYRRTDYFQRRRELMEAWARWVISEIVA